MSRFFKSAAFPILIVIVLAFFASKLISNSDRADRQSFSQFLTQVERGTQIKSVTLREKDNSAQVTLRQGDKKYEVGYPPDYASVLVNKLRSAEANRRINDFDVKPAKSNVLLSLLTFALPVIILIGFWIFLMNQVQGGGSKVMSFGKSRAKRLSVDSPKITFRDVAGVDEAVEELHEIKEFLENPKKFQALGARIPKGVLLYGPPGTGKTLLAKAVAREAEANFIATKSSDLLSKWYGESEQQIARLFARARQVAPTVIFFDELDSLVPMRGGGMGEPQVTERVVNTILAEMDGLEELQSVVVIGATNRPNLIDPALLRPGRFDELIYVSVPNEAGRRRILDIHTAKMPLADDVDLDAIARRTERFTGADLEDLVRRAGLFALRESLENQTVDAGNFEKALDDTRASVTPEIEREYEQIAAKIKQDAVALAPIGFVSPGMLKPRGEKRGE